VTTLSEAPRAGITLDEISALPSRGNRERLLTKEVMEFYGVKTRYDLEGKIDRYFFPLVAPGSSVPTGYKSKNPADKSKTFTVGDAAGVFGLEHFRTGGRRIIITEGEEDACAIQVANFARWKRAYPVISMGGATQTKYLLEERDTLIKFDEIILWFDNDEEGQRAVAEAAKILGYERVKVVVSDEKDANDVLRTEKGADRILGYIMDANPFNPSGLLSGEALWNELARYDEVESIPYPESMVGLNEKLKGMRLGEITLLTSGSGTGKSSIIREMILHLRETQPNTRIGVVALEESPGETAKKLAGLAINRNPSYEEVPLADLRVGFDRVFGSDSIIVLDHAGSATDSRVIDLIEFMCAS